ncbi:hypothetical protein CALCODRAFT_492955, partial [Calocera cornea HHB12733]
MPAPAQEEDFGTWLSPAEGSTIGLHRDSVLVSYQAQQAEQFVPRAVNIDVQQNTSPIDEENSWTTASRLALPVNGANPDP